MKTLALTLVAFGLFCAAPATDAAIRVKVGPVSVAAGRRLPVRHVRPVYVAPRPVVAPAVVARGSVANAVANRVDTIHDIREERFDTFQDAVEDRVDTVRDIREQRRQAAWDLLQSLQP